MMHMPQLALNSPVRRIVPMLALVVALALVLLALPPQLAAASVLAAPFLLGLYAYQQRTGRDVRGAAMIAVMALLVASSLVAPTLTHAQSATVDFDAADLDIFFLWFNTMFNAILPIGLLGAGIAAGVAFVWVVSRMLTKAFTSMLGGLGGG